MLNDFYVVDLSDIDGRDLNNKRIMIQLPPGLKIYRSDIEDMVKKATNGAMLFSGHDCYGACDIPSTCGIDVDAIIQVGHERMGNISYSLPTYFVKIYVKEELILNLDQLIIELRNKKIFKVAFIYSIPYENISRKVGIILKENGIEPINEEGDYRVNRKYGMILGCNFSTVENLLDSVDGILFIGDGIFHPLPILFKTDKPLYSYNPLTGFVKALNVEKNKLIRSRYLMIERGFSIKKWGIIASVKPGQYRLWLAKSLRKMAMLKNIDCTILLVDQVNADDFAGYRFGGLVSTACSRIAIDDAEKFNVPVVTPHEFMIILGYRDLSDYRFDEMW